MSQAEQHFDLVVLGGGPGGYPAAIKAAQNGLKVGLIEAGVLGGTCLNRGCIPTKALIANADLVRRIQHASDFGISCGEVVLDYARMSHRKDGIVERLKHGLEGTIAANGIMVLRGFGKFVAPLQLKVTGQDNLLLSAKNVIIATGSEPRNMKAFPFDDERILSSTSILKRTSLPDSLVIIGGGVIGCEFASLYAALGVRVVVLEMLGSILSMQPKAVVGAISKAFVRRGITVRVEVAVSGIDRTDKGVAVILASGERVEADLALVAVGRSRNTSNIGLEKAGVLTSDSGEIITNDRMETNVPGIYAVGDVTGNWWLAHVATHQGIVAAQRVVGENSRMLYNAVPSVVFTDPEIATVGMTAEEANRAGYSPVIGTYPFEALGKSLAAGHPEGFAQIVADRGSGQVLGAQVVGYEAATLVAEMGLAIANELTVECLLDTIHAHPTIAEAWHEATLIAYETPLHFPPKRRKGSTKLMEQVLSGRE